MSKLNDLCLAGASREEIIEAQDKEIESLRKQLAAALAERDEAETRSANLRHKLYLENEKTAAALAAIKVKDGALRFYKSALTADDVAGVALAATADLGRYVLCESEAVAWLWQRNYSNGGYTREVCQFEGKARELAEDGKNLPTPDSVTPLYRAWEPKT